MMRWLLLRSADEIVLELCPDGVWQVRINDDPKFATNLVEDAIAYVNKHHTPQDYKAQYLQELYEKYGIRFNREQD